MKKNKYLLFALPLLSFIISCEPEEIPSENYLEEMTTAKIYSDTGEEGGPIDDKKD